MQTSSISIAFGIITITIAIVVAIVCTPSKWLSLVGNSQVVSEKKAKPNKRRACAKRNRRKTHSVCKTKYLSLHMYLFIYQRRHYHDDDDDDDVSPTAGGSHLHRSYQKLANTGEINRTESNKRQQTNISPRNNMSQNK